MKTTKTLSTTLLIAGLMASACTGQSPAASKSSSPTSSASPAYRISPANTWYLLPTPTLGVMTTWFTQGPYSDVGHVFAKLRERVANSGAKEPAVVIVRADLAPTPGKPSGEVEVRGADHSTKIAPFDPHDPSYVGAFVGADGGPATWSPAPFDKIDSSAVGLALPFLIDQLLVSDPKGRTISFVWDANQPDIWLVSLEKVASTPFNGLVVKPTAEGLFLPLRPEDARRPLIIDPSPIGLVDYKDLPPGLIIDKETEPPGGFVLWANAREFIRSRDQGRLGVSVYLHYSTQSAIAHMSSLVMGLSGGAATGKTRRFTAAPMGDDSADFLETTPEGPIAETVVVRIANAVVTGLAVVARSADTSDIREILAPQVRKLDGLKVGLAERSPK